MNNHSRAILRFEKVQVRFGGVTALNVDNLALFDAAPVACLLGPNGAGKSTTINAATAYANVAPGGTIYLENGTTQTLSGFDRSRVVNAGIARTFQIPVACESVTVRESLALAAMFNARPWTERFAGLFRYARPASPAAVLVEHLLERFEIRGYADTLLRDLPFLILRRVEFSRCLAVQAQIIFLDEPTAGADSKEIEFIGSLVTTGVAELCASLHTQGLYRFREVCFGVVSHDRAFLDLLSRMPTTPVAYTFERGELKSRQPLTQWLKGTSHGN